MSDTVLKSEKPHGAHGPGSESGPSSVETARATSWVERAAPWIARHHLALIFVLGVLAFAPAITSPYLLDDYLHRSMVQGTFPATRAPWDLYSFVDDTTRDLMFERGLLPWWAAPNLTIRFFRPLSSLVLYADHAVLGGSPLAQHLHSFAWWVAVVVAAGALFRRLLPSRAAILALLIFALAPCHAVPLVWLANREALMTLAFGVPALVAYLDFRESGERRSAWLALLGFSVAMAAGEYALSLGAYVAAFELVRRRRGAVRESLTGPIVGIALFAVPATMYLGVRASMGYGARGSGFYTDPFDAPQLFVASAPRRLASLVVEAWASLDQNHIHSRLSWAALAVIVVVVVGAASLAIWHTWSALDAPLRGRVEWLLLGSVGALVPALAVVPSPRLLGTSLLGVASVVALVLDTAWFVRPAPHTEPGYATRPVRWMPEFANLAVLALGFAHLVHGPMTSWLLARGFHETTSDFGEAAEALRDRIGDPGGRDVVLLRSRAGGLFFLPFAMADDGHFPAHYRVLAESDHVLVQRPAPNQLLVATSVDSGIFPGPEGNLFVNQEREFHEGDVFEVPGLRAEVRSIENGRPRVMLYELADVGDDVVWLNETNSGYEPVRIPDVGFGAPFDP